MSRVDPACSRRGVAVTAVTLVMGALAVGLPGCGGGASSADLTLADWQTQADAICVAVRLEADADQPVTGAGNPAVPIRAQAVVVDNAADRLSDLGKPDEQADTVDDLLLAMTRQADALNERADVLLADPNADAGSASAAVAVETDKIDRAAAELGVAGCAPQAGTDTGPDTGAGVGTPSSDDPPADGGFGDQGQTADG